MKDSREKGKYGTKKVKGSRAIHKFDSHHIRIRNVQV